MTRSGTSGNENRTITVTLAQDHRRGHDRHRDRSRRPSRNMAATPTAYTFTLHHPRCCAIPVGTTFSLRGQQQQRRQQPAQHRAVTVHRGGQFSRIDLNSATVINVDSIQTWNAAFNGGAQQGTFYPGATVFVRAPDQRSVRQLRHLGCAPAGSPMPRRQRGTPVTNRPMTPQGAPATCGATNCSQLRLPVQYTLPHPSRRLALEHPRARHRGRGRTCSTTAWTRSPSRIPQPSVTMVKSSGAVGPPGARQSQAHSAVDGAIRDHASTNSGPGTRGCQHAGDHRSDPGEYRDVRRRPRREIP